MYLGFLDLETENDDEILKDSMGGYRQWQGPPKYVSEIHEIVISAIP